MMRNTKIAFKNAKRYLRTHSHKHLSKTYIPERADVAIIGGGSAGCNTLYHLANRGVNAVLLERHKLTAGTTWHTGGLLWRLRPNDIDTTLLNRTRDILTEIKRTTDYDAGWHQNGGIFIARNRDRLDEYKRLSTFGHALGIENQIMSPEEAQQNIFPLLNSKSFYGALYSPGDGIIDPTMMCNALTRLAAETEYGLVVEDCAVKKFLTEKSATGKESIVGVETNHGVIKTGCVVNATGVWGRDLCNTLGFSIPLIPMRHSYVVSEPIDGVFGMPNLRDHDGSIYFAIQGSSIHMGGYEINPDLIDKVPIDFNFSLYELDWSTFEDHVKHTVELCPAFEKAGIKSTVCGPEAFTPDHKPIMGPDPRCSGLFHNCGFNSSGMMFGSGCAEQLAEWIVHGRPSIDMFAFDIRRFAENQIDDREWATQRSHEAYAHNYSMIFKHDQPLAGRNYTFDTLFDDMLRNGAFMEEKHGFERPGFFNTDLAPLLVAPYDWYGAYESKPNKDTDYVNVLKGDYTYGVSKNHDLIGQEALACRNKAAIFNLSYFCKLYITGRDASKLMCWLCTSNTNKPKNSVIYTCALNNKGGVEADFTAIPIESGNGKITDPKFYDSGYYIVAGGASAFYTKSHIENVIEENAFDVELHDVTKKIGIISIQGPESRKVLESFVDFDLCDNNLPAYSSRVGNFIHQHSEESRLIRLIRVSFVGELGYEIHAGSDDCRYIYEKIMNIGRDYGLKNSGYRALYSLSCEKGYHLWSMDLRSDDTPIEANLGTFCKRNEKYLGHLTVEKQLKNGVYKKLVYLTLDDFVPIWGLEGVYRNGEAVGYLRRAEFGYAINKFIGKAYITRRDEGIVTDDYLTQGKYEIDVLGKRYPATIHLKSAFDPQNKRIHGIYTP